MEGNTYENVVCEMADILSRPQCVKQNQLNLTLWYGIINKVGNFLFVKKETNKVCSYIHVYVENNYLSTHNFICNLAGSPPKSGHWREITFHPFIGMKLLIHKFHFLWHGANYIISSPSWRPSFAVPSTSLRLDIGPLVAYNGIMGDYQLIAAKCFWTRNCDVEIRKC